ncbi:MAG: fatty acid desaturase [Bacteriovoracaceae bacterium]
METTEVQAKEVLEESETTEKSESKKLESELKSLGEYNREVSKQMPKETFKREPTRLKYTVMYSGGILASIYVLMTFELPWFVKLPISIIMGIFLAGNTFLTHEILHGAIVKNKKLQNVLGFIGLGPFLISPTYWRFWHNTLHHGNTQLLYKDPDAFPTKMVWKKSKFMKFVFPLSPGSGYLRSYFYFFYWFSFQAVLNQAYMRFGNKMWAKMNHQQVTKEFVLIVGLALCYIVAVGPSNWLWLVAIPFFAQNYTVMSYISTNHNVSPLTKVNDPLVNSLTVTNSPILEFLNLNFGYHTEHHLFPSMPASQAKKVSNKLKEMYPDKYMTMPKSKALRLLYSTPRIYKNRDILIHPETEKEYATLGREDKL